MGSPEKFSLESEIAWTLDGRRLTLFNLLLLVLTIAGGTLLGTRLALALASFGIQALGRLGWYAGGVVGFVLGLAIAGLCAWLLVGFVMWLGLGWLVWQKKRRGA